MWRTIAGHGVDHQIIPRKQFELLSVIAAHGPQGAFQSDLFKIANHDKHSAPKRTDDLATKGYIIKYKVIAASLHTAICKLAKFTSEGEKSWPKYVKAFHERPPDTRIVYYDFWFTDILRLIEENNGIIVFEDLRIGLGVHRNELGRRTLARCLERVIDIGLFEKVQATVVSETSGAPDSTARCLRQLREATEADRKVFTGTTDSKTRVQRGKLTKGRYTFSKPEAAKKESEHDSDGQLDSDSESEPEFPALNDDSPVSTPKQKATSGRKRQARAASTSTSPSTADDHDFTQLSPRLLARKEGRFSLAQTVPNKRFASNNAAFLNPIAPRKHDFNDPNLVHVLQDSAFDEWGFSKINPSPYPVDYERTRWTLARNPFIAASRDTVAMGASANATGDSKQAESLIRQKRVRNGRITPRRSKADLVVALVRAAGRKSAVGKRQPAATVASNAEAVANTRLVSQLTHPGAYVDPPGALEVRFADRTCRGRRPKAKIIVIKLEKLSNLPGFNVAAEASPVVNNLPHMQANAQILTGSNDASEDICDRALVPAVGELATSTVSSDSIDTPVAASELLGNATAASFVGPLTDTVSSTAKPGPDATMQATPIELDPQAHANRIGFPDAARSPSPSEAPPSGKRKRQRIDEGASPPSKRAKSDISLIVKLPLPAALLQATQDASAAGRSGDIRDIDKDAISADVNVLRGSASTHIEVLSETDTCESTNRGLATAKEISDGSPAPATPSSLHGQIAHENDDLNLEPDMMEQGTAKYQPDVQVSAMKTVPEILEPVETDSMAHAGRAERRKKRQVNGYERFTFIPGVAVRRTAEGLAVTQADAQAKIEYDRERLGEAVQAARASKALKKKMYIATRPTKVVEIPLPDLLCPGQRWHAQSGTISTLGSTDSADKHYTLEWEWRLYHNRPVDLQHILLRTSQYSSASVSTSESSSARFRAEIAQVAAWEQSLTDKKIIASIAQDWTFINHGLYYPYPPSVAYFEPVTGGDFFEQKPPFGESDTKIKVASISSRTTMPRTFQADSEPLLSEDGLPQSNLARPYYISSTTNAATAPANHIIYPYPNLQSPANPSSFFATSWPASFSSAVSGGTYWYTGSSVSHAPRVTALDPVLMDCDRCVKFKKKCMGGSKNSKCGLCKRQRLLCSKVDADRERLNKWGRLTEPASARPTISLGEHGLRAPVTLDRSVGLIPFAPQTAALVAPSVPEAIVPGFGLNAISGSGATSPAAAALETSGNSVTSDIADAPTINDNAVTSPAAIAPAKNGSGAAGSIATASATSTEKKPYVYKPNRGVPKQPVPRLRRKSRASITNHASLSESSLFPPRQRLAIAVNLVRLLCGSLYVDPITDFAIVAQALEYQYPKESLHDQWKSEEEPCATFSHNLQQALEEAMPIAFEEGTLPVIDTGHMERTDWSGLISWVESSVLPLDKLKNLPATRQAFDAQWDVMLTAIAPYESAAREERGQDLDQSIQGQGPQVPDDTAGSHITPATLQMIEVKSLIRALCMTADDQYNELEAYRKLAGIDVALQEEAISQLQQSGTIICRKAGRLLPGRNFSINKDALTMFNRWQPGNNELPFLNNVASSWTKIVEHLLEHDEFRLDRKATESDQLVLTNLVAQNLVRPAVDLAAIRIEPTSDGGDFSLPIYYSKTSSFTSQHGLRSSVVAPVQPSTRFERAVPLWVDIHGNIIVEAWNMVIRSVLHVLAFQGAMTASGVARAHGRQLWAWEATMILTWMEEVGVARNLNLGVDTVEPLWGACEWWYCAFLPGITTHAPEDRHNAAIAGQVEDPENKLVDGTERD